ncbi:MAG: hypothetical protein JW768_13500, partial [Chitinispirillaceae bacterium]|nr:hypothetical protein [Chitinispirillaceae bacterium]
VPVRYNDFIFRRERGPVDAVTFVMPGILRFTVQEPGPLQIALFSLRGQLAWSRMMEATAGTCMMHIEPRYLETASGLRVLSIKRSGHPMCQAIIPMTSGQTK